MQDSAKREQEKIKELWREYSAKGYRVVMEPGITELPDFMKQLNFHPDMIVYGENQSLVIEVKTSQTIGDARNFTHLADEVKRHEGWDFILVLTNPASDVTEEIQTRPSSNFAERQFREAEDLLVAGSNNQFKNAALLVAWAGLEAALRHSMITLYKREKTVTPQTLVRDSAMYGIISRDDSTVIESTMKIRNAVAHGFPGPEITTRQVKTIIQIGRSVLQEADSTDCAAAEF